MSDPRYPAIETTDVSDNRELYIYNLQHGYTFDVPNDAQDVNQIAADYLVLPIDSSSRHELIVLLNDRATHAFALRTCLNHVTSSQQRSALTRSERSRTVDFQ